MSEDWDMILRFAEGLENIVEPGEHLRPPPPRPPGEKKKGLKNLPARAQAT